MPVSGPEDLHSSFAAAMQVKDVDALLELYEPDAIVILPDGTQLAGPAALRAMFTGLIAAGMGTQGVPRKILIADDIALSQRPTR